MNFRKGEIVPYAIVERKKKYYKMIVFGCDVEVVGDTIYPIKPMKNNECIIYCRPGVKENVKSSYKAWLEPRVK